MDLTKTKKFNDLVLLLLDKCISSLVGEEQSNIIILNYID